MGNFVICTHIMRVVRPRGMKRAWRNRSRGEMRDAYRILFGKPEMMRIIGEI